MSIPELRDLSDLFFESKRDLFDVTNRPSNNLVPFIISLSSDDSAPLAAAVHNWIQVVRLVLR